MSNVLSVRVLGKLFRHAHCLLEMYAAGRLQFFGEQICLGDHRVFHRHLAPVRNKRWVVYAKPPFAGSDAVLAYLSRYTHRVAISNRRLNSLGETGVTFRNKDCRLDGADRHRTMTLAVDEFIRRFLLHVPEAVLASVGPSRSSKSHRPPPPARGFVLRDFRSPPGARNSSR